MPGPQPTGTMRVELDPAADCDGHPGVGSLILTYDFWSGSSASQAVEIGARKLAVQGALPAWLKQPLRSCTYRHSKARTTKKYHNRRCINTIAIAAVSTIIDASLAETAD